MGNKIKVLLVDDLRQNLLALESLLAQEKNLETVSALGGQKALETLLDHEFALALIDVQMPDINGFELAKLIRGTKKLKDLPIIFVTAHSPSEESLFQGYETGAVDFLFKPINPTILISKVRVLVDLFKKNKELAELTVKAKEGSESKSRFLAHMSHEMRTPLTAIQGFVELLEEGAGKEEREQAAEVIRRNVHYLVEIIDDILDLAKIEANKLDISSTIFKPEELIKDVYTSLRGRAKEKGLEFFLEYATDLPDKVMGDPTRVRQALINILSNAIKYTDKGSVSLVVSFENENAPLLRFSVKDTGRGIKPEERDKIFEPFYRALSAKSLEGSGLGLSLTKRLVNAMGGDIYFESAPEKGSVFEFFFNARLPKGARLTRPDQDCEKFKGEKPAASHEKKIKCHVLIVDDNEDIRRLAVGMVSSATSEASLASNGVEAIAKVKELERAGRPVNVILMDLQMPEMDGIRATKKLRKAGFKGAVIAFSAHVMEQDRGKCFEAGCTDFISKPVKKKELLGKIRFHCQ